MPLNRKGYSRLNNQPRSLRLERVGAGAGARAIGGATGAGAMTFVAANLAGNCDPRLLREILKDAYAHGMAIIAAFDPKLFPVSVPAAITVSDAPAAGGHGGVYAAPGPRSADH